MLYIFFCRYRTFTSLHFMLLLCKRPHIFISSCQLSIFQFCWIWYVEAKDIKIGELICIFDFMIIIWLWEMMFKSRLLLLSLFFFFWHCVYVVSNLGTYGNFWKFYFNLEEFYMYKFRKRYKQCCLVEWCGPRAFCFGLNLFYC